MDMTATNNNMRSKSCVGNTATKGVPSGEEAQILFLAPIDPEALSRAFTITGKQEKNIRMLAESLTEEHCLVGTVKLIIHYVVLPASTNCINYWPIFTRNGAVL